MMPRVLLLTHAGFLPALQGDAVRVLGLVRGLKQGGCTVGVLNCHDAEQTGGVDYPAMRAYCDWLMPFHPPDATGDMSPAGLDVLCPDGLPQAVRYAVQHFRPHALLVQFAYFSRCLLGVATDPALLKILDADNIFHLRRTRFRQAAIDENWVDCDAAEERVAWSRADILLAIQDEERAWLCRSLPDTPVLLTPPCLTAVAHPAPVTGKRLLFVGANNPANASGVERFLRQGWPCVRGRHHDAEFFIVGEVCRALGPMPAGVRLLGRCDDLRREYRQATLLLNCVEAASGISIKTVEALCAGKCLVTYPAGATGLPDRADVLVRCDSPLSMADAVVHLLDCPDEAMRIAVNAHRFARDFFAPGNAMAPLVHAVHRWSFSTRLPGWSAQRHRQAWLARERACAAKDSV